MTQASRSAPGGRFLLKPAWLLPDPARGLVHANWAVLVEDGRVAALGPVGELADPAGRAADVVELPGALLAPALVNAHQHGRGISQLLLGYPDDQLEPWIAQRTRRGAPDAYALTRLAALEMLRNGVGCAVHANYSYGSGDYEAEARAAIQAYLDAGLRVTFCVGAMDRGFPIYPDHLRDRLLESLPEPQRRFVDARRTSPYAGGAEQTIALMRRLQADFGTHRLVTLAYGPAGPQWVSDALLVALARDAAEHGLGLHMHLLESPVQARVASESYAEGLLAHLEHLGALGPRTVMAHGVHLRAEDIEVIARTQTIVVHNPGSNLRLSNGTAPLARLLQAGVTVAIGTDNCALSDTEDLLGELRLADMLARRDPAIYRFDAARLLAMVTANGARAALVDDRVGRIAPGWEADLTAVDLARVTHPYLDPDMPLVDAFVQRAQGSSVVFTMVAGRIRYCRGEFPGQDPQAVAQAAAVTARRYSLSSEPGAADAAEALGAAIRDLHGLS